MKELSIRQWPDPRDDEIVRLRCDRHEWKRRWAIVVRELFRIVGPRGPGKRTTEVLRDALGILAAGEGERLECRPVPSPEGDGCAIGCRHVRPRGWYESAGMVAHYFADGEESSLCGLAHREDGHAWLTRLARARCELCEAKLAKQRPARARATDGVPVSQVKVVGGEIEPGPPRGPRCGEEPR